MGLIWAVIGVLPNDDNLDVFKSRIFERIENVVHGGINGMLAVFVSKKTAQFLISLPLKVIFEYFIPTVANVYHVSIISRYCVFCKIKEQVVPALYVQLFFYSKYAWGCAHTGHTAGAPTPVWT